MPLNSAAAATVAEQIVTAIKVPDDAKKPAIDSWTKIVTAIFQGVTSNAQVIPTGLVAPPTGGPVTGTGKVE